MKNSILVDTGFKFGMSQIRSEIETLIDLFETEDIHNVLEIGSKLGGNFYILSSICSGRRISIDLPGGTHGGWILNKHPYLEDILLKRNEYFSKPPFCASMITGDSHLQATFGAVKNILEEEKLGLLYIDGDHTYKGVKRDFELYSPLVKEGGFIIFHDIVKSDFHIKTNCFVWKLWEELIKEPFKSYEINAGEHWGGIGVLQV